MLAPLLTGAMLGLSVAAPFGPIALLCAQRSIAVGPRLGIVTGLGAASVHGLYASLAILGADSVSVLLAEWGRPVRLLSAVILMVLGARVLARRPPAAHSSAPVRARDAFASSFAVAVCNPLTVLPYLLVASGGIAAGAAEGALSAWSVPGVFLGALGWYAALSSSAALFRSGLSRRGVTLLNRVAGAMLIAFGLKTGLG